MLTVKLNTSKTSLSAKIDRALDEKAKPLLQNKLIEVAGTLTALSPVWSGAYVTSHSFVPKGSGGGRSRKSVYGTGPVDVRMAQDIGFEQLVSDINKVDFMASKGGVFRNRAEHAREVEDGGVAPNGTPTQAHAVYRTTKARYK
jgi:hypothetical protein